MTKEDAFEVAKMAAFAGGQLKVIDNFTTERTNNPANKINIDNFIHFVNNPNFNPSSNSYLNQYPPGYAPPPPEDYIQSVEPDKSIGSLPTTSVPLQQIPQSLPVAHQEKTIEPVKSTQIQNEVISKKDIDSIKGTLKNINSSLKLIVDIIKKTNE